MAMGVASLSTDSGFVTSPIVSGFATSPIVSDCATSPIVSGLSLRELEAQITELAGHLNAADHRWLVLIAEFDRRNGWSDGLTQSCAIGSVGSAGSSWARRVKRSASP